MPVTTAQPFSWQNPSADDSAMLAQLQPNILKGHPRDFMTAVFVTIGNPAEAKAFFKALVQPAAGTPLMKTALKQLQEALAFKNAGTPGTVYVGVGITAAGYVALGVPAAKQPADPSFQAGMRSAAIQTKLVDPLKATFDPTFKGNIHAVIIVGDSTAQSRDATLATVKALMPASMVEVGREVGTGLHNANGDGIEHFGYVDGRSQPLFLTEDVTDERLGTDGTNVWDPAFGPARVIVSDPGAQNPALHFGSYFVFRKLEQNVKAFKTEEDKLATRLGLTGADAERAGAMIVGRFEDGTPLTNQLADGNHNPVPNNFNYGSDPNGAKQPFFSHIRKVNPRGSGGFEAEPQERLHIMARRGQTYGVRADNPNDGQLTNKPTKDVGLLFMAFNANIAQQFEFAQSTWANNATFPAVPAGFPAPGLDLVIGQIKPGPRPQPRCPVTWGADPNVPAQNKTVIAPVQTVTLKGGEYFFMPSLATLAAL